MTETNLPSHWADMHRLWTYLGAPLRPPAEAVKSAVDAAGKAAAGRTLVLGVTPEFHAALREVVALDAHPGMIAAVWPGDDDGHRAVLGNWMTDIPALGRFDLCLGDLALSQVKADDARRVIALVAAALNPGGRIVHRVIRRPEAPVTEAAIRALAEGPDFNFHGLRVTIGLRLSQTIGSTFPVAAIHDTFCRIFPDREDFLARTGLPRERLALVDHYARSTQTWYVPGAGELLSLAEGTGLSAVLEPSGDYPFARDLPLLVMGG